MNLLIKNAIVFYGGSCKQEDLLIGNGKILEIRNKIPSKVGIDQVDGTDCYILPGFISSTTLDCQKALEHGITTLIKDIGVNDGQDSESQLETTHKDPEFPLDYIYRFSLQAFDKRILEHLDKEGIRFISVETFPKDWEPWIMRIRRLGLVLDLRYDQQKEVTSLGLPSVVSYSDCRKPCRSRLVVRVRESEMDSWIKGWRQLRPYTPRSYWLDSLTITCPILRSKEDLIQYLMFITHVCSRVPAKLLGIFPRKGSIHIGADADLLFFRGKNMLDRCPSLVPDKVMVKGQFIQEFLTLKTSRRGEFLVGNQTYAFEY